MLKLEKKYSRKQRPRKVKENSQDGSEWIPELGFELGFRFSCSPFSTPVCRFSQRLRESNDIEKNRKSTALQNSTWNIEIFFEVIPSNEYFISHVGKYVSFLKKILL